MKQLFKSRRFKVIAGVIALLLVGALICAANGRGETAQSGIVGTIFAPANWVASKISDGITYVFGEATGNAEYLERIDELENQVGSLQDQLADYENLKKQNELNKGTASGIKDGDAVLYGNYIVGIIDRAYPTYSVVKTILDPDFSVSAYEIVSGEISYVTGRADLASEGKCIMANLDSSTAVTYGSIIATAGISGKIPEGLIIGTVEEIEEDTSSVASYAVIKPGVDVNNISECLVLTGYESEAQ